MTFTTKLLIDNYINAYDVDGKFWYYDLMFAPGGMDSNNTEIETEASRYVIGWHRCSRRSRGRDRRGRG